VGRHQEVGQEAAGGGQALPVEQDPRLEFADHQRRPQHDQADHGDGDAAAPGRIGMGGRGAHSEQAPTASLTGVSSCSGDGVRRRAVRSGTARRSSRRVTRSRGRSNTMRPSRRPTMRGKCARQVDLVQAADQRGVARRRASCCSVAKVSSDSTGSSADSGSSTRRPWPATAASAPGRSAGARRRTGGRRGHTACRRGRSATAPARRLPDRQA
jgi:hypothetical protein